jgi:hypothetical protein
MPDQPAPPEQPAPDEIADETAADGSGETAAAEAGETAAAEGMEYSEAIAEQDEPAPATNDGDDEPAAEAAVTVAAAAAPAAYRPPAPPLGAPPPPPPPGAPVGAASPGGGEGGETTFEVLYPAQSSRLWAALLLLFGLKFLVLIVHAVVLAVLQVGAFFVFVVAQLVVLVTGQMPEGMHRFQTRVIAQGNKMNAWLYGLTDELPPFFLSDDPYPVETSVGHPPESSRLWALLNIVWLKPLALLPHLVILYVLAIAMMVVVFIAQIVILVSGTYSRGMFDFIVGVMRWQTRMNAFLWGLRDEYPPFSLS